MSYSSICTAALQLPLQRPLHAAMGNPPTAAAVSRPPACGNLSSQDEPLDPCSLDRLEPQEIKPGGQPRAGVVHPIPRGLVPACLECCGVEKCAHGATGNVEHPQDDR